jgi:hypothetical protein
VLFNFLLLLIWKIFVYGKFLANSLQYFFATYCTNTTLLFLIWQIIVYGKFFAKSLKYFFATCWTYTTGTTSCFVYGEFFANSLQYFFATCCTNTTGITSCFLVTHIQARFYVFVVYFSSTYLQKIIVYNLEIIFILFFLFQ